ncbi:hypothetical protein ACHAPT_009834 [Fusarium lateritium]
MICLESLQEFLQARKAVRRCAKATNGEFRTVYGFYLTMMGVRYNDGDSGGYRTLWPGQYAWLLNNGLVSWDHHKSWGFSREEIEDKNKADGPVKVAAFLQVEKPKDIATASFVDLPEMTPLQREKFEGLVMDTYDVLDPSQKQSNAIAWYVVPRDCRDDEVLIMAQDEQEMDEPYFSSSRDGSNSTKDLIVSQVEDTNVITEWDASHYMTRYWPLLCLLGASFGAIHLISWVSVFPSEVELWL